MRRLLLLAVSALVLLPLAGCGSDGVTTGRLDAAVGTSFARLYVLHEQTLQHTPVSTTQMRTRVQCGRGDATAPASGPGEDWLCNISWDRANGAPGGATYSLHVSNLACYTADGDGPVGLNDTPTITTPQGAAVTNPLWQFDGCFDPH